MCDARCSSLGLSVPKGARLIGFVDDLALVVVAEFMKVKQFMQSNIFRIG